MAHEHHGAQVYYGPHHHMGCYPRAQQWKVVPADVLHELRQADLPVDKEPPQPQW